MEPTAHDSLVPLVLEILDGLAVVATRGWSRVKLVLERTVEGALRIEKLTTSLDPALARPVVDLGVEPGAVFGAMNEALGELEAELRARAIAWDSAVLLAERGTDGSATVSLVNRDDTTAHTIAPPPAALGALFHTDALMDLAGEAQIEAARRQTAFVADLPEHDGWNYDQATSVLELLDHKEPRVQLRADVIGTWAEESGTWMWAWANSSVDPRCAAISARLLAWARGRPGLSVLVRPSLPCGDGFASVLAAITAVQGGARGLYRATYGGGVMYLAVMPGAASD